MLVEELIKQLEQYNGNDTVKIEYIDYTTYLPERDKIQNIYKDEHGDVCISSIIQKT
jgi:hypothetical protein